MAWQVTLRVGDTSAQDIPLTSSGVFITDYPLSAPDVDQSLLQNLGDGNGLSIPSWSNVTESIDLHISAATPALVQDKVRAIERLLDLARQGTQGMLDDRLYLLIQFDHDTEPWRSQILAAKWESATATSQIWKNFVAGSIVLTRRYYFETASYHSIPLVSATTTTPTTGYVTVYNADDSHATQRNWFQIADDVIQGSIPTPAYISIINASGATRRVSSVHLGNYIWNGNDTVDPIFRGEEAPGGSLVFDTTESDGVWWALTGDNLTDAFRGQFGRVICVFSSRPEPTTLVRAALQLRFPTPVIDLALAEQVLNQTSDYVMDLGSVPIPPGAQWQDISGFMNLSIKGKTNSGTDTIGVDWVQVFPAGAGRYRRLNGVTTFSLTTGDLVVDDGNLDSAFASGEGFNIPIFRSLFSPIHLWPKKRQRLRMLISAGSFAMEPGQACGVTVACRFRRLTL